MPRVVLNEYSPTFTFADWNNDPPKATGSAAASFGGGFLFYSNNPESVTESALADKGCWLNRQSVSGAGQVYLWHQNDTGKYIRSVVSIYNPNSYSINVTSTNYGTTNANGESDMNAWKKYLQTPSPIPITIAPYSYGSLFDQYVAPGNNFGVVARLNITSGGSPAGAIVYDLAYEYDSSAAWRIASPSGDKECGIGYGFYNSLNFGAIAPKDTLGLYYGFGYYEDSFNGNDLVEITGGNSTGKIEGSFGQQLVITLPVRNSFNTTRTFRIAVGSRGGATIPVVNAYNAIGSKGWVSAYNAVDLIEAEIPGNQTTNLTFTLMICAISASPLYIGARVL